MKNNQYKINNAQWEGAQFWDIYGISNPSELYLEDIALTRGILVKEGPLQRMVNYSVDYLAKTALTNLFENQYVVEFDDPSTLTIDSLVDDVTFVYLARNDGKILRGSPLLWGCRHIFSDPKELEVLEKNEYTTDGGVKSMIDNGFLKIENSILRL